MTANQHTEKSAVQNTTSPKKRRTTKKTTDSQLFSNLHTAGAWKEIRCMREAVGLDANIEHTWLYTAEAICWPDAYGNYTMMSEGKYALLDKYGEKIRPETFDALLPYQDDLYIARRDNQLFFVDASSWELFFLDEKTGDVMSQTTDGAEVVCDNEKLGEIKKRVLQLHPKTYPEVLKRVLVNLLYEFEVAFVSSDEDRVLVNSRKISKNYKKLLSALHGAYWYFYHGEITPALAGVNAELRPDLFQFPFLRERLPDIYLAMHELQKVKEVLVNPQGKVLGYIEKKGERYGYKTPDQKWVEGVEFDDFRGPDTQGHIIFRRGKKDYFVGENFPDEDNGFDQIAGADAGGNYLASLGGDKYLIKADSSFFTMPNCSVKGKVFKAIQPLDKNGNYLMIHQSGVIVANKELGTISDRYFHIDAADQNGLYEVIDLDGSTLLDANGTNLLPQMHDQIVPLEDGNYKLLLDKKYGLFLPKGKKYVPCDYDAIDPLVSGMYKVSRGEQWGWMNDQWEEIIPPGKYDLIEEADQYGLYPVMKITRENFITKVLQGMVNDKWVEVMPCEFNQITPHKAGHYTAKKDDVEMSYTREGILFTYDPFEDREASTRIRLQLLRSQRWDYVEEADPNGLFEVSKIDATYGFVTHGMMKDLETEIIPCEYDKITLREDWKYVASFPEKDHIFDHEGIMRDCDFWDESKREARELYQLYKDRYRDIVGSGEWDYVGKADQNGLFEVNKVIESEVYSGLLKDKDTPAIPCEYDMISHKHGTIYTVQKSGETIEKDVQSYIE